ncbi:rhomboid family intramembrane serine protease GlpG [Aliivibrio fischeri]|uniref:rhomboid family intramembrane serine protease GlpG n=1 Tax=Aliivibrio fischeri TaxID=668 RepID=UPI00084C7FAF|nr:rhomboid family intramembrane serine protease GlpG [Aliivibrio fischeri]OED55418.1 rhomboid family intramembrane serine protease GlpG [Aliivibrio fischeri]
MQRLIALSNPRAGQAFIDYMASRHIDIRMMPEGDGQFALWVVSDDAYLLEVESELQAFLRNPNDVKYQSASWDMADTRTAKFAYGSPNLIKMIKAKAGIFTLSIMLVCIVIFALQQLGWNNSIFQALHFPAYQGQSVEVWRWFSHALLHFSATHIIFNLLWWWQLGGDIELRLGRTKLVQLFLFSALFSGLGQFWVEGANFGGLSGVVYALLGYSWFIGWLAPERGVSVSKPIVGFMLIWLVLGYVQPFMAIANTAHLAGLITGCVIAGIDSRFKRSSLS